MADEPPKISEAEWDVMNVVWDESPRSALDVAKALEPTRGWNHRTVKTLINRLVKKAVLGFQVEGPRYLYFPQVSREECVRAESRSFLRRVAPDSVSPLLAHFMRESDLSPGEIDELRQLLDEKRRAAKDQEGDA